MSDDSIATRARQAAEAERRYAETRRRQSDGSGFNLDQIAAVEARADLFEALAEGVLEPGDEAASNERAREECIGANLPTGFAGRLTSTPAVSER
jgi:hypothetical protein